MRGWRCEGWREGGGGGEVKVLELVKVTIQQNYEVQTSPINRNHALKHLTQSTEPRAVLGSKYVNYGHASSVCEA